MTAAGPEPVVRLARREDLAAIMALLADDDLSAGREGGLDSGAAAAFDEIERDPSSSEHVLELEGRVVGCAQLTVIPGLARRQVRRGVIEAVRVASDLRGRGFGRLLIRALVAEAEARGCGLVQLTSDKRRLEAHRFYRSLGFAQSHEGFKLLVG